MRGGCAIALYLAASGCSPGPQSQMPPGTGLASAADHGAQLYQQNCLPCHREDAGGVPGVYPSLAGSAVANGDAVALTRWVLKGVRPPSLPAGRYATQMLRFDWMRDEDAAQLLTYVRSHFGNQGSVVDPALVARARGD